VEIVQRMPFARQFQATQVARQNGQSKWLLATMLDYSDRIAPCGKFMDALQRWWVEFARS
jgi:hypothetical protein